MGVEIYIVLYSKILNATGVENKKKKYNFSA
jgi:hypothetical protein